MDSNHRSKKQQIYSLPPLATRELFLIIYSFKWSWRWDSNPRPADYKSAALPTELRQHILVGMTGFEPAPLWSQTRCATKLRYIPSLNSTRISYHFPNHFATYKIYEFQRYFKIIFVLLLFSSENKSVLLFSRNQFADAVQQNHSAETEYRVYGLHQCPEWYKRKYQRHCA